MKKYFTIFQISWQNEFTYRLNFLLWRVRNILRLLMTYFLWQGIFVSNTRVFGYSQSQMLAYVFLVLAVQSFVASAPSGDNIGGEIASGDLSNYLLKPVSYIKYWFTRDLSSKFLNLVFAGIEITLLWFLLRPPLNLNFQPVSVISFVVLAGLASVLYFFLSFLSRLTSFWSPENTWGLSFLLLILIEVLAGGIFPLDILPGPAQIFLQFTPFPYLVYYPIAVALGKITGLHLLRIFLQTLIWLVLLNKVSKYFWTKGLKNYGSEGR